MRRIILLLGIVALFAVVHACREEGAAEKAGRKVDEAVEKLQHPKEGPLEKLGRKTDEAIDDAKEMIEGE